MRNEGATPAGQGGLKWYFAINEKGAEGGLGAHAKLAVISAQRNTSLRPHLLTTGFRNAFTQWMEARGVVLVDATQPLAETIRASETIGGYHTRYLGHWLRCEIPLIETQDEFVLYTDSDVVFLDEVRLAGERPAYIACAPEFKMQGSNYFSSGVMLMNVAGMRESLPGFLDLARRQIGAFRDGVAHNDQYAYNTYYREVVSPLDPRYNWKPYWGDPSGSTILHFHGPKIHALRAMYRLAIEWEEPYWRAAGTLVLSNLEGYRLSVAAALAHADELEPAERRPLTEAAEHLAETPMPMPPELFDAEVLEMEYRYDPALPCLRERRPFPSWTRGLAEGARRLIG